MRASHVNGIGGCTIAWLLFAISAHGMDFRDSRGEWRVEWQKNEQRTNDGLPTPGIALSPWHVVGSLLGEIQGEWHPRFRFYFRGEAIFRESGRQSGGRFRLIEGALHYEITPLVFLDVGKVLEKWGTGYAFNPVNVLLPPENPAEPHANHPGVTLLKLEILGERSTFSAILAGVDDEKPLNRPSSFRIRKTKEGLLSSGIIRLAISIFPGFTCREEWKGIACGIISRAALSHRRRCLQRVALPGMRSWENPSKSTGNTRCNGVGVTRSPR